jgi:hypothetical protein
MFAMRAMMQKAVEELNAITIVPGNMLKFLWVPLVVFLQGFKPFWLHPVGAGLIKDLYFIEGGLKVVRRRALYL